MRIIITFQRNDNVLTSFEREVTTPAQIRAVLPEAYDMFRRENPEVDLFDDVVVIFDKED